MTNFNIKIYWVFFVEQLSPETTNARALMRSLPYLDIFLSSGERALPEQVPTLEPTSQGLGHVQDNSCQQVWTGHRRARDHRHL